MRYNEAQYNTYSHDHKIDYEPTVIKIVYGKWYKYAQNSGTAHYSKYGTETYISL